MKILAIDTSTIYLSLAVTDDEKVLARFHKKAEMSHSSLLIPMIDKLLKKAKVRLKDIGGFAVSIGPGSFTGLRIGAVTIKGLALALKKPIVAVPTLDAIAENARRFRGYIVPVLDARKNKVYSCAYKSDGKSVKRLSKYLLLGLEELMGKVRPLKGEKVFLGDMTGLSEIKKWHPKAETVARLALPAFRKRRFTSPEDLEPLYLYSKECDITGK